MEQGEKSRTWSDMIEISPRAVAVAHGNGHGMAIVLGLHRMKKRRGITKFKIQNSKFKLSGNRIAYCEAFCCSVCALALTLFPRPTTSAARSPKAEN
jgi:hypothetical protein